MESPLLLVGDRLIDDESEHEDRCHHIDPAEWFRGVHADKGREGQHKDERVLIDRNEEQIENEPHRPVIKRRVERSTFQR